MTPDGAAPLWVQALGAVLGILIGALIVLWKDL